MRWRGHRAHRFCERCRSRAPAPVLKAWAARPPQTTRRPRTTSLPSADRDRQRSPPPNDARGTVSPSVRGTSSRRGPSCGKVAHSTNSPTSSTTATATDALWGSTPMSTFMRTHLRSGWASAIGGVREGHSDFGPCTPLLSHSARRGRQRDASLEQANPLPKSGRNFASDPYWRPRSLQRLQTTELLTKVKQVGSRHPCPNMGHLPHRQGSRTY